MENTLFNPSLPRSQRLFFQNFVSSDDIIDDFRKDPKQFLSKYGVDVSALNIPDNFEVPPREVLEERFQQYFGYDEFGAPAMYAIPFVVFLVFLVPQFAH